MLPSMQDGMLTTWRAQQMLATSPSHNKEPTMGQQGYITPHDMHGAAARYRMTLYARVKCWESTSLQATLSHTLKTRSTLL